MMTYKFYDTCSLLLKANHLFDEENVVIAVSSISLQELEDIKTAYNKDAEIKYSARKVLRELNEHMGEFDIYVYKESMMEPIIKKGFDHITNDLRILACAFDYDTNMHPDETVFVTNDLALKAIANCFFGDDSIESVNEETLDQYNGFKEVVMGDDESLAFFYQNLDQNHFDLMVNQYLVIKDCGGSVVDRLCWTGETHRRLQYNDFFSHWLGAVRPIKGDTYQMLLADSLANNQITMAKGPAGSGKTYMSLGYLFHQLEKHKIDKIIVFCNTVATKDSAKLGFYPGTRDEKLLDSQIGNLLSSKLGGKIEVERLIQNELLVLLPLSDIRGYDTSGMRAGIYISEAQNMTVSLMKLALQRIGEDSICIIDGDDKTQVDSVEFAGNNNGMRRASKVFRGNDMYGEVELQTIHRSRIAALAEEM